MLVKVLKPYASFAGGRPRSYTVDDLVVIDDPVAITNMVAKGIIEVVEPLPDDEVRPEVLKPTTKTKRRSK